MASGVPPVCAAAGGLINLVRDGQTGCLFRPGGAADMSAKVRRRLDALALTTPNPNPTP